VQSKSGSEEVVGLGLHGCHRGIEGQTGLKRVLGIMSALEGPDGGAFDLRGW
jgi:hypothetical protein